MHNLFGDLARDTRVRARKTLKQVAGALELSVVYISDIERGNRRAPSPEMARRWAQIVDGDPDQFERYAKLDRDDVELPINRSNIDWIGNEAAVLLARSWEGLSEKQLRQIVGIVTQD